MCRQLHIQGARGARQASAGSVTMTSALGGNVKRTITGLARLGPKYAVGDQIEAYYHDEQAWYD